MPKQEKSPDKIRRTPLTPRQRLESARFAACTMLFGLRNWGDISETFDMFRHQDDIRGLTEGTIIGNPVWFPMQPNIFAFQGTSAGHWVGIDFDRPMIFPPRKGGTTRQPWKGALYSMYIDEVKDRSPEQRTPNRLLKPLRFDHFASYDKTTPERAIGDGLLRATTYGEAFRQLGFAENFGEELEARNLVDSQVFQVTPKGNTLVFYWAIPASQKRGQTPSQASPLRRACQSPKKYKQMRGLGLRWRLDLRRREF